jgi:pimeloyl-ACP methyl ester carboxylesterase
MRITLKDYAIEVDEAGKGLPLILIHGYPLSRRIWQPQMEGLAPSAHTIAPDLRGHGDSESTEGVYTMDLLAADCLGVLDALGEQKPAVVCGLSMGGYVAFAFYRNYPDRVAGLILAATRAGEDSPEARSNREKAVVQAQKYGSGSIAEAMLPKMFSPKTYTQRPELVQRVWEIMQGISVDGIVGDLKGMMERPDSFSTLKQVNKPVLILHGNEDQLIPLNEAVAMRAASPLARLRVIQDAGHLLNMEQPELFNKHVNEFITGIEA